MAVYSSLDLLARVLHLFGVIVWMGHNYVNVIQNPLFKPFDPTDAASLTAALKREHAIFRHASLVTLATGVYMLWYRGVLHDAFTLSGSATVIGVGVWIGILMVLNLWLVLWPHQKKVLGIVAADDATRVRCSRITFLSSRTNTILSIAAFFFMISGAHGLFLYM